jgi:hypothetical protein
MKVENWPWPDDPPVARNFELERELTDLAARAAGYLNDGGLGRFADLRAAPFGGVRTNLNSDREFCEEAADGRNYLVWGLVQARDGYLRGEPDATDDYERRLRALSHLVGAFQAINVRSVR